jgi:hypothetical protein
MKLPRSKPTLLWHTALRDISAGGRVMDPEDVVWLWQLAERVYTAPGRRLAFTRAPIVLGAKWREHLAPASDQALLIFPITLQATEWLLNVSAWWEGSDLIPAAFACAHSDGADHPIFHETDRRAIENAVFAWSSLQPCTPDDLRAAVQIQTTTPDVMVDTQSGTGVPPVDTSATNWGEILASLSGAYHIPPWELITRPYADISDMLDALPSVAALYRDVAQDRDRRLALREFQEAVLYLKRCP